VFTDSLDREVLPQPLRLAGSRHERSAGDCERSRAEATLAALHADGAGWPGRWMALRELLGGLLRPTSPACAGCPHRPISAQCGALLYQLAQLARCRLRAAGVSRYVDLREGQPEQALLRIEQPVDCLLFSGYPLLMLPLLKQLQEKLRSGAVVIALRPAGERRAYAAYLRYVRDPLGGFTSIELPCREHIELSVKR